MMIDGKVFWITGASSGIGRATALAAARKGARIVLTARREDRLHDLERELPGSGHHVLPADLTQVDTLAALAQQVEARFGRVDLLFNNAGVSQRSLVAGTDMGVYRSLMEINYFAPVALTRAVLPMMTRQRSGHIIAMSSVAGKIGAPLRSGYCGAKHAVHGFFDALRAESAHLGIEVSVVVAGYVHTDVSVNALAGDGSRHAKMDATQAGGVSAEDAAAAILAGIEAGRREILVGKGAEMKALWFKRFMPERLFRRIEADTAKAFGAAAR